MFKIKSPKLTVSSILDVGHHLLAPTPAHDARSRLAAEQDVFRRYTILVLTSVLVLVSMSVIYPPKNLNGVLVHPGIIAASLMLCNLVILRITHNIAFTTSASMLIIFALLGHMIFNGIDTTQATFWAFQYILFAHLFTGVRQGSVWLIATFVIILAAIRLDQLGYIDFNYSTQMLLSLIITAITTTVLVSVYEGSINKYSDIITDKQVSLNERNAFNSAIISNLGDGLIVTDTHGLITMINTEAMNLLGRDSIEDMESLVGQSIFTDLPIHDQNDKLVLEDRHPVRYVLDSGQRLNTVAAASSYSYIRKDGTTMPVSMSVAPVFYKGKISGTVQVFRDTSWQEEIDESKNDFVSFASHQLRTPLSSINWTSELLESGSEPLSDNQLKLVENIRASSKNMTELVNALLDVSRLELGTVELQKSNVSLPELIHEVIDEYSNAESFNGVELDLKLPDHEVFVHTDQKFLKMVIDNLYSNALKYTSEGAVRVSLQNVKEDVEIGGVSMPGDGVLLMVADSGYGIPEHEQSKIFQKLFRADNIRQTNVNGTGLGLYLAHLIVEYMKGKIWFRSIQDKGTSFYVYLPNN